MYSFTALTYSLLIQGRILEHAGDLPAAAALADEARSMDLADRYLNSECVMRMLQADQVFCQKWMFNVPNDILVWINFCFCTWK